MWNKRDEVLPAGASSRPIQGEPARKDATPPAAPVTSERSMEPAAKSIATIGTSMIIKGQIHSVEEMYIDGEVEGKLDLQQRLTIGPRGQVRADIKAREVVILGNVRGNVEVSDKITIQKNGSLIGDVKTAGIVIDDGAYFKGSIDIARSTPVVKAEPLKVASASGG
jgi:cytoskeletal protein CcmA (bactofilin family)